jgi:ABC-type transport system involved in multi-copper enzyme maturation permease subunit
VNYAQGHQAYFLRAVALENMPADALSGYPIFGGAIALMLGVLALGSEYSWGPLRTLLVQGQSRLGVLGAKLAALAVVTLGYTLAIVAFAAVSASVLAVVNHVPAHAPRLSDLVGAIAAGWLIMMVYMVIGVFLGVTLRGAAVAMAVGLAYALAFETLLDGFSRESSLALQIARFLPGPNAGSMVGHLFPSARGGAPGVVDVSSMFQALSVLGLWGVAAAAAGALLFWRRDVT